MICPDDEEKWDDIEFDYELKTDLVDENLNIKK